MTFPLNLLDISLLFAVTSIILLVTSALLSPSYGKINVLISKKKLRNAAITFSLLFLITVFVRAASII
jgi:hypothetical protein